MKKKKTLGRYMGPERRGYSDTRDLAVEAKTSIDQHMTDCTAFREVVQNTLTEFREDIKKLNWRMAMIVGGVTVLGKVFDFVIPVIMKVHP